MSIGNKEVYPFGMSNTGNPMSYNLGLTYREWLIGMALSNAQIVSFLESATYDQNIEVNTKAVFDSVDAIIKQLDKE